MPIDRGMDLETMREILKGGEVHLSLAVIRKLILADDRSVLKVDCELFPDELTVTARMTWEQVGPDAGIFGFPAVGDLVLVGFPEDREDDALVIKRLSSKQDKIPVQAVSGDTVVKALSGKNAHILSDTKLLFGRGGENDPEEPLVLGAVFKEAYSNTLAALQKQADTSQAHTHIGNLGFNTAPPDSASVQAFGEVSQEAADIKSDPVDNENVLSDLGFTEK